jgi:hypothetical protein
MGVNSCVILIMPKWHVNEGYNSVRFKTVTSVTMRITIILNVMLCNGGNFRAPSSGRRGTKLPPVCMVLHTKDIAVILCYKCVFTLIIH